MRELIRSLLTEPRAADPPRRVWRDWVLVALLVAGCLAEGLLRPDLPMRALSTIVAIALVPTLLWRRTHPFAMVAVVFGTIVAVDVGRLLAGAGPWGLNTFIYVLVTAYALFRWGSGREMLLGLGLMMVPATMALVFDDTVPSEAIGGFAVFFAVLGIGTAVRYRTGERARRLEEVRLHEREQFARDLHDTVAHHVSAIAIRAQAGLAVSAARPEAAAEALRVIEAEASRALAEMRAMVRFLRSDEPATLAPNPQVSDLHRLAGLTAEGQQVIVELDGDLDELPSSVSSAVYRLAQESITNARRHARGATRIEVEVWADADAVHLSIRDDGVALAGRASAAGYGLRGMSERALLLGGTCTAGPGVDRGWSVSAVLPRAGDAR